MSSQDEDRGMRAVLRARSVREQDSRIGLRRALAVAQGHRDTLEHLNDLLTEYGARSGDTGAFRTTRTSLMWVGEAITSEQERLEVAQRVADTARERWQHDKIRLSAVEHLLERRAEERRAERERKERAELDDIAGQLWIRNRDVG